MDIKEYYNQESSHYSRKRYEGITDTYVKYFFRRRLALVIKYLGRVPGGSVLEVGTADGVLLRVIRNRFQNKFTQLVGVDIAPDMIDSAKALSVGQRIDFFTKGKTPIDKFDCILLVGFMTPELLASERDYILSHLKPGGHIVISMPSKLSLHARLKLREADYVKGYATYPEYDEMLKCDFEIIDTQYYGFFVPKLWALPSIARVLQPIIDTVFKHFFPNLYHEALYLLRSNNH